MDIYLVRHGETDGNARRILQVPETPLSPQGFAQARLVARRLADEKISRLLSSDLRRAVMTAEIVGAASGVAIEQNELLRERNFGDLRGRAYDSLEINIFETGYDPPGGEPWNSFLERVDRAWDFVVRTASGLEGKLAVITHGYFLFMLACRRLPVVPPLASPGFFSNTSVTIVDGDPPHTVRLLNCTRHLEGSSPK